MQLSQSSCGFFDQEVMPGRCCGRLLVSCWDPCAATLRQRGRHAGHFAYSMSQNKLQLVSSELLASRQYRLLADVASSRGGKCGALVHWDCFPCLKFQRSGRMGNSQVNSECDLVPDRIGSLQPTCAPGFHMGAQTAQIT
eukprot:5929141-Amphidinium_carterae.3